MGVRDWNNQLCSWNRERLGTRSLAAWKNPMIIFECVNEKSESWQRYFSTPSFFACRNRFSASFSDAMHFWRNYYCFFFLMWWHFPSFLLCLEADQGTTCLIFASPFSAPLSSRHRRSRECHALLLFCFVSEVFGSIFATFQNMKSCLHASSSSIPYQSKFHHHDLYFKCEKPIPMVFSRISYKENLYQIVCHSNFKKKTSILK